MYPKQSIRELIVLTATNCPDQNIEQDWFEYKTGTRNAIVLSSLTLTHYYSLRRFVFFFLAANSCRLLSSQPFERWRSWSVLPPPQKCFAAVFIFDRLIVCNTALKIFHDCEHIRKLVNHSFMHPTCVCVCVWWIYLWIYLICEIRLGTPQILACRIFHDSEQKHQRSCFVHYCYESIVHYSSCLLMLDARVREIPKWNILWGKIMFI